ncbi:MAG TPA: HAD-IA family hydrolase [Candidatus Binataceae bacterium]|nr:HAD-IA family hydrolase [Candidatus Binataceae bacterium]
MLKVVFFDAAGTLFDTRNPVGATYAEVARKYGVDAKVADVNAAFRRVFHHTPGLAFGLGHSAADLRDLERRWWYRLVAESFHGLGTFTDYDAYFEELFARFGSTATWQIDPMALSTLGQLRDRGLALGMISNFDYRLYGILDGLGLKDEFQSITISSEAGWAKPAAEIFQTALAKHGIASHEALHVGDSEHLDIAGAAGVGIASVLIDPNAPARIAIDGRVARVATLDAVLEAVDRLAFP